MPKPRQPDEVHTFLVKVPKVEGLSIRDAREYVREAVQSHAGGGHTEDPLFGVFRKIVVINSLNLTIKELNRKTLLKLRSEIAEKFFKSGYSGTVCADVLSAMDRAITCNEESRDV